MPVMSSLGLTRWLLHSYFNEVLPNLRMVNYTEEVKTVFGQALSKNTLKVIG